MANYLTMYDEKEHLYAYDLDAIGGEATFEIEAVTGGVLEGVAGGKPKKTKKPMVKLVGEKKKLAVNKTNGKTIAQLYSKDTDRWIGKLITLYSTTTEFGGETVACIRVRPERPEGPARNASSGRAAGAGGAGGGNQRSTPARDAAADQQSAIAARYLIDKYTVIAVTTASAADGEAMATLKSERAKVWAQLNEADRIAVGEAAKAAKARIDSFAIDTAIADGGGASKIAEPDAEEAAQLLRDEAAKAAAEAGP